MFSFFCKVIEGEHKLMLSLPWVLKVDIAQ